MPPTLIISADHDIARDEAKLLADRLDQLGGAVWYRPIRGVFHDFVLFAPAIEAASLERSAIAQLLRDTAAQP